MACTASAVHTCMPLHGLGGGGVNVRPCMALVWVRLGATQLTRTLGASSAESARLGRCGYRLQPDGGPGARGCSL